MSLPLNATQTVEIKADWEINPRAVPTVANQLLLRLATGGSGAPSGMQMTLGFVGGPVVAGDPQAAGFDPTVISAPIVVVGEYYLALDTAENLHAVLGRLLSDVKVSQNAAK